jgi:hypothetical protein
VDRVAVTRDDDGDHDPRLAPLDDDELAFLHSESSSEEKLSLGGSSSLRGKSREYEGDEAPPEQLLTPEMTGGGDIGDDGTIPVILPSLPSKTKRHRTIAFRRMEKSSLHQLTKKQREAGSSRWLRVVDVTLDEDTSDGDDGAVKKADAKMIDIGDETTIPAIGHHRRPHRRTRPNNDATKEGDQERNNKRRKLGLTVISSRAVLESDFLREEGRQRQQSMMPTVSATTATGEEYDDAFVNEPGVIVERRDDTLDSEILRLIEWSLIALHNQGGGSVMPHLAFLKDDPRLLAYRRMMTGMCWMIDVALVNDVDMPDGSVYGKGRTVLHIAAMWGDVGGVKESMAMGASVTSIDARGDTPSDLKKKTMLITRRWMRVTGPRSKSCKRVLAT